MKIPPKPKTRYVFPEAQDRRIFAKLKLLGRRELNRDQQVILKLFFSQMEDDWRTPLEKFVDKLLRTW
ncbi:MAG: hypothetical protein A3A44_02750 [Candidatus Sungbacteria bacterium RIFCSPLOWO2_01_FULL_60_25]|uniref:Uncharacterized protein n=1 Tax=Candidatus Sungbacteria bacterium RIFCSPLOWO2_01_FULL_60_25 TaxID=1802281 RepID=A0A1G2LE00_9BACT|nr:MAG: hypothetical protein A3A44_02750 [Candidatus Sungbacteria bacterium RIFCSPLOWO2_01_FULL_60_25]